MRFLVFLLMFLPGAALADCVILLHGLARTENSFVVMETALEREGYTVVRPGYASTEKSVENLINPTLPDAVATCGKQKVHFITHSMGGILLRLWLGTDRPADMGRVVMLGPPNHGSEIVDEWGDRKLFVQLNGPAGASIGRDGVFTELPNVEFDLGIIAGSRSLNPYFLYLITGPDDGKVSIEATKVAGM